MRDPHPLLASVHTHDVSARRPYFTDLLAAETTAVWNYAPRQVGKLLLTVLGKLALASAGKSLVRALPFVGIVVGGAANKVLTARVGKAVLATLAERDVDADREPEQEPVDARIEPAPGPEPGAEGTPARSGRKGKGKGSPDASEGGDA